jgi:dienelactone hydrolase
MNTRPAIISLLAAVAVIASFSTAGAELRSETVSYQQDGTDLRGYLVYDDAGADGKRPGVIVVHEWWGLNDYARERAEALAKEGFVALAIDMYGEGKSTDHPQQAGEWATWIRTNRDVGGARFMAGYEVLREHSLTREDQIAAIGYCFGGSVVLTMALSGADLEGVVSFHGGLPTEPSTVDEITTKILVCHGAADATISPEQIGTFLGNLEAAGADYQFISYGGAKHSFTSKAADERGIPVLAYDADADRRSWQAMLAFFGEIFDN